MKELEWQSNSAFAVDILDRLNELNLKYCKVKAFLHLNSVQNISIKAHAALEAV